MPCNDCLNVPAASDGYIKVGHNIKVGRRQYGASCCWLLWHDFWVPTGSNWHQLSNYSGFRRILQPFGVTPKGAGLLTPGSLLHCHRMAQAEHVVACVYLWLSSPAPLHVCSSKGLRREYFPEDKFGLGACGNIMLIGGGDAVL